MALRYIIKRSGWRSNAALIRLQLQAIKSLSVGLMTGEGLSLMECCKVLESWENTLPQPQWPGTGLSKFRLYEIYHSIPAPAALNGAWVMGRLENQNR